MCNCYLLWHCCCAGAIILCHTWNWFFFCSLQCPEPCLFHHIKPFITLPRHVLDYWHFCHLCSKCCIPVSLSGVFADLEVALKMYKSEKFLNKNGTLFFQSVCYFWFFWFWFLWSWCTEELADSVLVHHFLIFSAAMKIFYLLTLKSC